MSLKYFVPHSNSPWITPIQIFSLAYIFMNLKKFAYNYAKLSIKIQYTNRWLLALWTKNTSTRQTTNFLELQTKNTAPQKSPSKLKASQVGKQKSDFSSTLADLPMPKWLAWPKLKIDSLCSKIGVCQSGHRKNKPTALVLWTVPYFHILKIDTGYFWKRKCVILETFCNIFHNIRYVYKT